ncbi:dienelactone hydrolase family protein [Frankia sp. AiPa1]|uniref:dienelactone hydrolase family protein n=1 Tax=Frankia sp. AiPa1 TaxID=573492 RepID=UPI00202AF6F4|nr:dienelactone hydrolase family protein [Frankia sp. AiPa1]
MTVVLPTPDGPARAILAEPEDVPVLGGIVVLHEADGLTGHVRDLCARLARVGWRAIAPDLYHRSAVLTGTEVLDDVDAAMGVLAEEGTALDRCAVVGFCLGGTVAFHAAVDRPFAAAVTFYGDGIRARQLGEPSQLELAGQLQAPWLGLYGGQDVNVPISDVEALRTATAGAPVPAEIIIYPNAGHAFLNDSRPDAYQGPAARDAWSRTLTWLGWRIPT